MFGPDDAFLTIILKLLRQLPIYPMFGRGRTRLQPAYVEDVAEAVARVIGRADGSGANSNCMRGVLGSMAYATLTKRRLTPRKVTKSSFKFGLLAGAPALLDSSWFREVIGHYEGGEEEIRRRQLRAVLRD
jgi:uncharacterized protein YbjT (DUF2867 family)